MNKDIKIGKQYDHTEEIKSCSNHKSYGNSQKCVDHLGNVFESNKAMAAYWNISYNIYGQRKKHGWSTAAILTTPVRIKSGSKEVVDHEGNIFPSENAMCKAYGMNLGTYVNRIENGWTKEAALTTPRTTIQKKEIIWNGNAYPSIVQLCKKVGIRYPNMFSRRLKSGMTVDNTMKLPNVHNTNLYGYGFRASLINDRTDPIIYCECECQICKKQNDDDPAYPEKYKSVLSLDQMIEHYKDHLIKEPELQNDPDIPYWLKLEMTDEGTWKGPALDHEKEPEEEIER